uniref:Uncharacterized protein n=1 Tax=Arion vulgaris TaxID=1028688 RepID=A0A0B7AV99_9EUPU
MSPLIKYCIRCQDRIIVFNSESYTFSHNIGYCSLLLLLVVSHMIENVWNVDIEQVSTL